MNNKTKVPAETSNRPTNLEEFILNEYFAMKEEFELNKEQLFMTKRALESVTSELNKLKSIITRHGNKVDPKDEHAYLHIGLSCWGEDDRDYPDYTFLRKFFPVKEETEEETTEEEK